MKKQLKKQLKKCKSKLKLIETKCKFNGQVYDSLEKIQTGIDLEEEKMKTNQLIQEESLHFFIPILASSLFIKLNLNLIVDESNNLTTILFGLRAQINDINSLVGKYNLENIILQQLEQQIRAHETSPQLPPPILPPQPILPSQPIPSSISKLATDAMIEQVVTQFSNNSTFSKNLKKNFAKPNTVCFFHLFHFF